MYSALRGDIAWTCGRGIALDGIVLNVMEPARLAQRLLRNVSALRVAGSNPARSILLWPADSCRWLECV